MLEMKRSVGDQYYCFTAIISLFSPYNFELCQAEIHIFLLCFAILFKIYTKQLSRLSGVSFQKS